MEEKALEGRTSTRVRFDDRWEYSYFDSSG